MVIIESWFHRKVLMEMHGQESLVSPSVTRGFVTTFNFSVGVRLVALKSFML